MKKRLTRNVARGPVGGQTLLAKEFPENDQRGMPRELSGEEGENCREARRLSNARRQGVPANQPARKRASERGTARHGTQTSEAKTRAKNGADLFACLFV